tara:strand:- start:3817 stop:4587 length:771 start_codon:yes stop_codon:yes gene_type:complete
MKVVILAGGFGSRISEKTHSIPKPMIEIGNKPIIMHIMERYIKYGYNDFLIALGYKSQIIKKYFADYHLMSSDFKVNLSNGCIETNKKNGLDCKVTLVETGLETMTGGRLNRLRNYLKDERFFLTYGDGVSNINIDKLLNHHINCSKFLTMSIVRPPARFGVLEINKDNILTKFEEKPQLSSGWINGGFFVVEPEFLDFCLSDNEMLEREPINRALNQNQISAYKHFGFWKCMDTLRDKNELEKIFNKGDSPWTVD